MRRDQQHDPHVMMAKEGCMKWIAKSVGTALQKKTFDMFCMQVSFL